MSNCQRCNSTRILNLNAKCSDCCDYTLRDKSEQGCAPHVDGVCGGDYINPDICLDCGQTQGKFPMPKLEIEAE